MAQDYNKLVRDNIINLIEDEGRKCNFKYLNDSDFNYALRKKLVEESIEVLYASNLDELQEELADILEVFETIINFHHLKINNLLQIKEKKYEDKGGFHKRIFLKNTI